MKLSKFKTRDFVAGEKYLIPGNAVMEFVRLDNDGYAVFKQLKPVDKGYMDYSINDEGMVRFPNDDEYYIVYKY